MKKSVLLAAVLSIIPLTALAQNVPSCSLGSFGAGDCSGSTWLPNLTSCQHATVTCNTFNGISFAQIGITFGYRNPTGTPNGTIVFFSEGGGKTTDDPPSDDTGSASKIYANYYNGAPYYYQVVQTAWDSDGPDWEDTTGTNSPPDTKNIAYAAGRPAAFLSWVNTNLYIPLTQQYKKPSMGMCVQGTSAGGAAAIYSLAWYGAYSFIDKVELLSSPPLSNINAGCSQNPTLGESVPVCPTGQLGCNSTNNPSSWTQSPSYTDELSSVRTWTGDITGDANSCRPNNGGYTTGTADAIWQAESIVDGTVGTFNYPQTQITSWVCSSSADQPMNNSSPQAQLFFQQFTNSSQIPYGLIINGVVGCQPTDESVAGGTPPQNYQNLGYGMNDGQGAIEYDMTQDPVNLCTSHHVN
jgi:hypothetical protein